MNRPTFALILAALIAIGVATVSGQAPDHQNGFLSNLKAGESVDVKEVAGRYEIRFDGGVAMIGHKVVEVGSDYLIVADNAGVSERRIPIFSIKSFVKFKVP